MIQLFEPDDDAAAAPGGVGFLERLENAGTRPPVEKSRAPRVRPWLVIMAVVVVVALAVLLYLNRIDDSPTTALFTQSKTTAPAASHPRGPAHSAPAPKPLDGPQLSLWLLERLPAPSASTPPQPFGDWGLVDNSIDTLASERGRRTLASGVAGQWSLNDALATTRNVDPAALTALPSEATERTPRHSKSPVSNRDAQLLESLMRQLGDQ
ncbi:hypothetical protein [Salinisphaera sp. Q1T1-3]|uniref:hypothetical protein n=1 Tax=Salinisphaera sp. Q1T1-3 TaxID=2321229 RepID=UPI0011C38CA7|nr:hypothetical protein [Salinisphaera sp. Q1T1-3]